MKFQKTRPATTYKKRIQKFMEVRLWKSKETRPVPEDESVKISISDEEPSGFSYEKKCEGRGCFIRSENTGLKKPTSVCSSPVKINNADGWFKKCNNALLNSQCKLKAGVKMVVFR